MALLKEEIVRKEKVIDELENQLEESNPVSSTQSVTSLASGATHGTTSTYKIDDVTLRNLFLSYLTADRDKQPEIAIVMSSILGYTQDVCKILCLKLIFEHKISLKSNFVSILGANIDV